MPPAPTVEGRLICACNCAYDVNSTGKLPTDPADRYYVGAGFLSTPAAFLDPTGIHGGLVGTTPAGVVLALRGTLSFNFHDRQSLRDWVNDLAAAPVPATWLPEGSDARVHEGFLKALETLVVQGIQAEVVRQLQVAGAGTKLLITGHSKGGGVAPLAAMRLWTQANLPSRVVTFAGPHAGNPAFADLYGNASITHARYEFQDDIVPLVPPMFGGILSHMEQVPVIGNLLPGLLQFDYEPVGNLRFIDWSNNIVGDSKVLQLDRLTHLAKIILTHQWDVFRLDHKISCEAGGPGYMPVVCPVGVCNG